MILHSKNFPYVSKDKRILKNLVTLGLGANISHPVRTLNALFLKLKQNKNLLIHSTSFIYKNKAFGVTNQPDFYNTTLIFSTNLTLRSVFSLIFYLERFFKRPRIRPYKNAPRTLDIDLLLFNNLRLKLPHLTLPHAGLLSRKSVLVPLYAQLGRKQ
ncbi:2-amino-4-hydroxy-6-hydroxymethyldihydropteridine diphosphokinase [Helicobacter sp. 11S02629-2]|uniref:2-amino-4-hydroxy-6- hydroxymethyldihydropteridine diphosphokinase n=1 Tax=Helicobacter sp. 11S02629-2 TaxID=1476195 RepID=UPI000BA528F7|nr:2-amino-4-hydroxy-6-hydroxymethyldihydropteridine diphosphokinase [Helicobacter sp. 11S02629-2]PAF46038.1 2-amino-4-hydroxy-6-hydroxymethyldihydropteridine diphosphokinase [Helicobacter sp. 11S02629-2]